MTTCTCGRPTSGAWLCDQCQTTFRYALANVAAYYDDLGNVERKQVRYGGNATKGSVGRAQPLPVDGRFLDRAAVGTQLAYDTKATVVAWVRSVQEDQDELAGPACLNACLHISCAAIRRRRFPRDTVQSMVNYLARQFRLIVSERWCLDMFDEMLDLEQRLSRLIDRPAERWYAGKCSETDESENTCEVELYATADSGTVKCHGCGTVHDVKQRRGFLLTEAKDIHVTASEAAVALLSWTDYDGTEKKLIDLIAYWRENHALDDHGVTEVKGQWRTVYRLGDVQERLIEHAQREQKRRIAPRKAS